MRANPSNSLRLIQWIPVALAGFLCGAAVFGKWNEHPPVSEARPLDNKLASSVKAATPSFPSVTSTGSTWTARPFEYQPDAKPVEPNANPADLPRPAAVGPDQLVLALGEQPPSAIIPELTAFAEKQALVKSILIQRYQAETDPDRRAKLRFLLLEMDGEEPAQLAQQMISSTNAGQRAEGYFLLSFGVQSEATTALLRDRLMQESDPAAMRVLAAAVYPNGELP